MSIVLPCFNEAGEIRSAIENLEKQTFKDTEIIVVDDGSSDGSGETAKRTIEENRFANARLVITQHSGPAHARNAGVAQAKAEVIFFAECDCVYDPDYLKRAMQALANEPDAGAVCLTGAPMVLRSTAATQCVMIENRLQHKLLNEGKLKPFYAWVFKRNILVSLGGFDEHLFQAEDKDLFGRLTAAGYKVAWVPGTHWWHKRSQTLRDVAVGSISRGRTRAAYVVKAHATTDAVRALAPLWGFVLGLILLPFIFYAGAVLVLLVISAVIFRAARVTVNAWDVVEKKRWFVVYPFFVLVRNFASGVGYTIGLFKIAFEPGRVTPSPTGFSAP